MYLFSGQHCCALSAGFAACKESGKSDVKFCSGCGKLYPCRALELGSQQKPHQALGALFHLVRDWAEIQQMQEWGVCAKLMNTLYQLYPQLLHLWKGRDILTSLWFLNKRLVGDPWVVPAPSEVTGMGFDFTGSGIFLLVLQVSVLAENLLFHLRRWWKMLLFTPSLAFSSVQDSV